MKLQLYPLDMQVCNFDLISYAHTIKVFFSNNIFRPRTQPLVPIPPSTDLIYDKLVMREVDINHIVFSQKFSSSGIPENFRSVVRCTVQDH